MTDVEHALLNVDDAFGTLRVSVISVVSGTVNAYTIDQVAELKSEIAATAEAEPQELSDKNGWGLGNVQIAVGDPSMSGEL